MGMSLTSELARVGGDRGQRELLRLARSLARQHRLGVTVATDLLQDRS